MAIGGLQGRRGYTARLSCSSAGSTRIRPWLLELVLELVNAQAALAAFPLQHIKCHEAAGDMMHLCPCRASLTPCQSERIVANTDDCFTLGAPPVQSTHLCGWPCEALHDAVRGAVADAQGFDRSCQPIVCRLIGMTPKGLEWLVIDPAIRF
jgi:hypothetical protein